MEALRDHLIELVSVRNLRHRPEALFALFRQFLQRLTLPRLCHFLDLVLPQLTAVRAPWADATRTLWTCHHIRAVSHENGYPYKPKVAIAYFYTAHDNIHHVRVLWSTLPLLLFSDPRMVYPVDVYQFQGQAVHRLNQQHIQLVLRKGMTVLVYYRVQSGVHVNEIFQAVLIAQESVANRGKRTENRLWKRVVPSETEFAWLPPNIAWAFCSDALRRRRECQYFAFNEAHMGLQGLLVMDPSLKVMVVTKENAAAHAFAKHIESLQLPPSLEEKFGRLVGATELEKGPASKTRLDVPPGYRNDVLRGKQVIIGCGGGFHQECSQPYSPVVRWMEEVDMALNDEGQQYGNLDESSAIARVPRKGLVVWCGDHKQTPGGLRKSEEARAFRRKLMRRPIALRGDTKFIPPHMLGAIVLPYVQDAPGPQVAGIRQMLHESTRQPLDLSSMSVTVLQELCQETIGRCWDAVTTPCCCAAFTVLWLALAAEKFPLQADTLSCAAGTAGKQKWSLILPSSARVSELTYVTIVGTRYPELDTFQNDIIQFGNYLQGEQCTRGGFLPIFWDAPYSYIHASADIGEVVDWIKGNFLVTKEGNKYLAVLHNRNKMVNAFASTEWVAGSEGAVLSRSVTSCAGMTAHLVLLAQTRVGFLSGCSIPTGPRKPHLSS